MFHTRHVEYDIIKYFAAFAIILCFFWPKKGEKHALLFKMAWMTTCYSRRYISWPQQSILAKLVSKSV